MAFKIHPHPPRAIHKFTYQVTCHHALFNMIVTKVAICY